MSRARDLADRVLHNRTHEDTEGGRESIVTFKGEQSGGEISTLAQIQASHDGTADDQKADLIFKTNDGSDNAAPTERLRIDSAGAILTATLGTDNVHLGEGAGASIVSGGNENVAIGKDAGSAITTGTDNTFVGMESGKNTTDRNHNTGVGNETLKTNVNGAKNVAVGSGALLTMNPASDSDTYNVAVGYDAGGSITTGVENTIVGAAAGDALTIGEKNVAIGEGALTADDVGSRNVAVGWDALGSQNAAGASVNNYYNVAVGANTGFSITSGYYNTFVGGLCGDDTDDGLNNTAMGFGALSANCDNDNTAVGASALGVCTGYHNTAIGKDAGGQVTTGGNMTFLGKDAGRTGSPGGAHTTGTNSVVIGDENIANIYAQVSVTATSDERDKTDFTPLNLGLDFVNDLSPVTYKWDRRIHYADKTDPNWRETVDLDTLTNDGTHKDDDLQVGFKAQEVIALEEAAGYRLSDETNLTATQTHDGKQFGLRYERFVPILTKAIQELSAKVDALETENTAIKARLDALEAE